MNKIVLFTAPKSDHSPFILRLVHCPPLNPVIFSENIVYICTYTQTYTPLINLQLLIAGIKKYSNLCSVSLYGMKTAVCINW